jgi:uncharacterized protein YjbI with pentapeptide repeats
MLPIDEYPGDWPNAPFRLSRDRFAAIKHANGDYLDLRGFPLAVLFNLHDARIDFSGAKSPKNEHGVDVGIRTDEIDLSDCLFDNAQTIASLRGTFADCSFARARMREAYLTAPFVNCIFDGVNLRSARCYHSTFKNCSFRGADLLKAELGGVTFDHCDLCEARFGRGAILGTKFLGCNLSGVDLMDAFRDEETLFDNDCNIDGLKYAMTVKLFGEEMDVGPAPTKRPPV